MPRKKSVVTENSEQEVLVPDEAGGAEDGQSTGEGMLPETVPGGEVAGDVPPGGDFPAAEDGPFPGADDTSLDSQPQEGSGMESDDPEYGALLQELGETGHADGGGDEPLAQGEMVRDVVGSLVQHVQIYAAVRRGAARSWRACRPRRAATPSCAAA